MDVVCLGPQRGPFQGQCNYSSSLIEVETRLLCGVVWCCSVLLQLVWHSLYLVLPKKNKKKRDIVCHGPRTGVALSKGSAWSPSLTLKQDISFTMLLICDMWCRNVLLQLLQHSLCLVLPKKGYCVPRPMPAHARVFSNGNAFPPSGPYQPPLKACMAPVRSWK